MHSKLQDKTFSRSIENKYFLKEVLPRFCELTLAIVAIVLLLPLLLICALLIYLGSPGKILFRQKRIGRDGRVFTLYKFRTMFTANNGLLITAANDRRITPVGKILRKTKFDELPELYNVLRGEMSFVGPRPEVVELVDFNNPLWKEVLSVRPGITDPVTLQFRNEENLLLNVEDKQAFYLDVIQPYKLNGYISYLNSKSLKKDLTIILQTFKVILLPKTAPPFNLTKICFQCFQKVKINDSVINKPLKSEKPKRITEVSARVQTKTR